LLEDFFTEISHLLKILDEIFYYIFRQNVQASDDECYQLELLCKIWRELAEFYQNHHLTPKMHLVEKHLAAAFTKFRCLGEFSEETIERCHHIYKIYHRRFCNVTEFNKQHYLIDIKESFKRSTEKHDILNRYLNSTTKESRIKQTENLLLQERLQRLKGLLLEEELKTSFNQFTANSQGLQEMDVVLECPNMNDHVPMEEDAEDQALSWSENNRDTTVETKEEVEDGDCECSEHIPADEQGFYAIPSPFSLGKEIDEIAERITSELMLIESKICSFM
jgi:hypothetical protein